MSAASSAFSAGERKSMGASTGTRRRPQRGGRGGVRGEANAALAGASSPTGDVSGHGVAPTCRDADVELQLASACAATAAVGARLEDALGRGELGARSGLA